MSAEGEQRTFREDLLELRLDTFTREALKAECERLSLSAQELVEFAIAYYLADLDSGRIARRIPRSDRTSPPGTR